MSVALRFFFWLLLSSTSFCGKKNPKEEKKKKTHLPGRYLAFSCLLLMSAHSAGSLSSMHTSRSAFCRASATAIAVPNEPPPKTATLLVASSADADPRLRSRKAALDHRMIESHDSRIWERSAGG